MTPFHSAIVKTLAYADIFDYPLTTPEIHRWLIGKNIASFPKLTKTPYWQKTGPHFHLPHRNKIVKLRRQRYHFSQLKLKQAQTISNYLKLIPSIKLIAITGALAMNNSKEQDDIDFIIITSKNRLWLTRLLAVIFLELFRLRRRPKSTSSQNKICLNLFLDESSLTLPSAQRNLYTAHEICQLKPLFNKNHTYQKLLLANSWAKQYLPNATQELKQGPTLKEKGNSLLDKLETLAYKLQLAYMRRRRTRELINPHSAFFHPRPTSKIILKQYHQKLKQLGLK